MADAKDKSRKLKRLTFRGKEIEELCEMKHENLWELMRSRVRRRMRRCNGLRGKYLKLVEKVKASKLNLGVGEKPKTIKTHLRNAIITPDMVGGVVAVYSGKEYKEFEIKFDMIGRYLAEFSLTYKPTLRKAQFVDKKKKGK